MFKMKNKWSLILLALPFGILLFIAYKILTNKKR